jgi:hypothetical protein
MTLISADDCASSRAECLKLLESFGASVILEDADGWGVLKCRIDEIRGEFAHCNTRTIAHWPRCHWDHHPQGCAIQDRVPPTLQLVPSIGFVRLRIR